jgi:hypothetical protein
MESGFFGETINTCNLQRRPLYRCAQNRFERYTRMLPQTVLFFLITLLFSLVIYSALGLVGGWFCRRALHHASAQLPTQRFPLEAYQSFIAARAHILARTQCIRGSFPGEWCFFRLRS